MEKLTRKGEIEAIVEDSLLAYKKVGLEDCIRKLNQQLLNKKVRFPLLEYAAQLLSEALDAEDRFSFCEKIKDLSTIGGNVLIGIVLQLHAEDKLLETVQTAKDIIADADEWYVCDIIGERVWGHLLRMRTGEFLPQMRDLMKDANPWVIRSLGAGIHNAVKKGLNSESVEKLFILLLSKARTQAQHEKQGIGWAAKTTAKFHPDIIERYAYQLADKEKVAQWFRTKVRIGLERNAYAKRN